VIASGSGKMKGNPRPETQRSNGQRPGGIAPAKGRIDFDYGGGVRRVASRVRPLVERSAAFAGMVLPTSRSLEVAQAPAGGIAPHPEAHLRPCEAWLRRDRFRPLASWRSHALHGRERLCPALLTSPRWGEVGAKCAACAPGEGAGRPRFLARPTFIGSEKTQ
jgi:hypothetical protein